MINIFESEIDIETQIKNGNYNFFSFKSFFGFDDAIRFIKNLYLYISFILNLIMVISIKKRKRKNFLNPTALQLISNILIINFIHSFSYMLNWITNLDHPYKITEDDKEYEIGGLLIGNAENLSVCKIQGFLILSSSLSQDISVNIFFYIINKEKVPNKKVIIIICMGLAIIFPFIFGITYTLIGGIGINDRYCYIKKFDYEKGDYHFYTLFPVLIIILYSFRGINLGISIFLLVNIIKYIRKNQLSTIYILKSSSILLIQIITFSIGFIYRISRIFIFSKNKVISDIHLCINTIDGILFPLSFSLSNGIYTNLCNKDFNDSSNTLSDSPYQINDDNSGSSSKISSDKTLALVDLKNANNFEWSYA